MNNSSSSSQSKPEESIGSELQDAQGNALGNLCILDQHPIEDPQKAENLLRVFGARAGAELERERADQALARLNQGTGLGLTLVKQIVELHSGSVTLASEFGQGSCFTVRLPYHAGAQQIISSPEPAPISITAEYSPSIAKNV